MPTLLTPSTAGCPFTWYRPPSAMPPLPQVFRAGKRNVQAARFQGHPRQQVGQFPADSAGPHGDLHARRRLLPAQLIDGVAQTFLAPAFPLEFFPDRKSVV